MDLQKQLPRVLPNSKGTPQRNFFLPDKRRKICKTTAACERCKRRKIKCDGNRPSCQRCTDSGETFCEYGLRKREIAKIALEDIEVKLTRHEQLFQDLLPYLPPHLQNKVRDVVKINDSPFSFQEQSQLSGSSQGKTSPTESVIEAEQEKLQVHHLPQLQILSQKQLQEPESVPSAIKDYILWECGMQTTTLNGSPETWFSLDSFPTCPRIITDAEANPRTLPPQSQCDFLLAIFYQRVFPTFPVLSWEVFHEQYLEVYSVSPDLKAPESVPQSWLSVLNLVLAIAAVYSRFSGEVVSELQAEIYFQRASRDEMLYFDRVMDIVDFRIVQRATLAAIYFLINNRIHAAQTMIKHSIRFSIGLGLDKKLNSILSHSSAQQEKRYQIWHVINYLESTVARLVRETSTNESYGSCQLPDISDKDRSFVGTQKLYLQNRRKMVEFQSTFFSCHMAVDFSKLLETVRLWFSSMDNGLDDGAQNVNSYKNMIEIPLRYHEVTMMAAVAIILLNDSADFDYTSLGLVDSITTYKSSAITSSQYVLQVFMSEDYDTIAGPVVWLYLLQAVLPALAITIYLMEDSSPEEVMAVVIQARSVLSKLEMTNLLGGNSAMGVGYLAKFTMISNELDKLFILATGSEDGKIQLPIPN